MHPCLRGYARYSRDALLVSESMKPTVKAGAAAIGRGWTAPIYWEARMVMPQTFKIREVT
jgi:hypothetical protein